MLLLPYRWFSGLVSLRERHPLRFPALFAVVCFVALTRAQLELLTAQQASYTFASILNNVTFYLLCAYLYSALACWITKKPLDSVTGMVAIGVFLGIFPPLIDTAIGGVGVGYYRYVPDGFSSWDWSLVNPRYYSTGETITLWILVAALSFYVLEVTRSLRAGLLAIVLSYAAVVFLALGPSTWALVLVEGATPFGRGAWYLAVSLIQIACAQACYLLVRPSLARRLWRRLPHALPFVCLALLGSSITEFFSSERLNPNDRYWLIGFSAWHIFQLCLIALVQNDAHDAKEDGRGAQVVLHDAHFFTVTGVVMVLLVMEAIPTAGTPMALFLLVSTLYSYDFYRAKRYFPSNYKCEGIWGWSAFVLGGSCPYALAKTSSLSWQFLLSGLLVFGGWSVFNAFKDYKDIRSDFKARTQTLYTLALRRGLRLRSVHNWMRMAMVASCAVPPVLLMLGGGDFLLFGLLGTGMTLILGSILGGPPRGRTVRFFLWAVSLYVLGMCAILEFQIMASQQEVHPELSVWVPETIPTPIGECSAMR